MNRWSLISLAGVASLAVVAGTVVAMIQSAPENPTTPSSPQPSPTMPSNHSTSETPAPTSQPAVRPSGSSSTQTPTTAEQSTPLSREIQSCVITMVKVDDPNPPLNIRSSPTTTADNVVGKLDNGTFLMVEKEQDGWLQITDPVKGWVAKSRTQHGCNQKVEQVQFASGQTSAEISDRIIGTGFHKYVFNAKAGQTMTVTRQSGPFPFLIAPNEQPLTQDMQDDRETWSGKLSATGDYTVQFDSNYKGYAYSFVIEIR